MKIEEKFKNLKEKNELKNEVKNERKIKTIKKRWPNFF